MADIASRSNARCVSCPTRAPRAWRSIGHRRVASRRIWRQREEVPPTLRRPGPRTPPSRPAVGRRPDWPPPRNGPCWCGSEREYKKCCGGSALM
ncbi:SEC-C metal-binding domain-containing protein [Streptomyces sp. NBC_01314]|uniref:SEC-C metal-binding domain-containing protein n=1 Tax=Streptomyces sp. NBC_01314 TaxID=2903821 RepID=UPI00352C7F40